jgi:hypothetical protein
MHERFLSDSIVAGLSNAGRLTILPPLPVKIAATDRASLTKGRVVGLC